jgi:hypothetical protein
MAKMLQPPPTVGVSTVSTSFFKVETLQTTDAVAVSTVSTKKHNIEIKNKIKANQLLAKCYTPSGGVDTLFLLLTCSFCL